MERLPLITPELVNAPFDHVDWIFEIKYDGFRSAAYIDDGKCELVSRSDHIYNRYEPLCRSLPGSFACDTAVFDGKLVVLDEQGLSQFYPMMFNKQAPIFAVFDVLMIDGDDVRELPLWQRKSLLEGRIVQGASNVLFVDHVEGKGKKLCEQICALDIEGIVAKPVESPYGMVKGRNPCGRSRTRHIARLRGGVRCFMGRGRSIDKKQRFRATDGACRLPTGAARSGAFAIRSCAGR